MAKHHIWIRELCQGCPLENTKENRTGGQQVRYRLLSPNVFITFLFHKGNRCAPHTNIFLRVMAKLGGLRWITKNSARMVQKVLTGNSK